jgi:hypothetical protein
LRNAEKSFKHNDSQLKHPKIIINVQMYGGVVCKLLESDN